MRAARILLMGIAWSMAGLAVRRSWIRPVAVARLVERKHRHAPAFVVADGANLISCQRLLRHRLLWRWICCCRNRSCEETRDPGTETDDLLHVHRLSPPVRASA